MYVYLYIYVFVYENRTVIQVKVKDSENRIESLSKALESAKQKNENSVIEITEITDRESAARDVSLQETIKQLERNNRHIKVKNQVISDATNSL